MFKKILAWFLVVALTATAAIGGTLAYLTDRDSEANVFTVGNVSIDLEEDFDQGATLIPGVDIEKKPTITNTGSNDAWVWAEIAIPSELNSTDTASKNIVHFNMSGASVADGLWNWWDGEDYSESTYFVTEKTIDGASYDVYTVQYETALKPGDTTAEPVITKVYLDPHVDIDPDGNWAWVENGAVTDINWNSNTDGSPVIYVSAYAMQTEGFGSVYAAYDAYQVQWGENGTEWGDPNASAADVWDGTADTSWYNDTDTEFEITTAEQLAGFADLVDGGNTFEGKTMKLGQDVDLGAKDAEGNLISFDPIGYGYDVVFKGTFDGQGHTISNLYQNGWDLGYSYGTQGGGLFASVVDATVKDVKIDGAEIVMECVDMGVLVGYSYGNCTYENISVSNSLIANYQRYTGGVVGEVNGTQTFKNVDVDDNTTVSSLWGDFDCSLGGIVGGKYGDATLTFEDCDVACEINAYNDVTSSYQWYAYRRAGMLIGNSEETATVDGKTSATASYLTATNCTVTYGDWVNYTYCEFAGTNWPYVRVQAGYSNDAYSNPRYGVATDANGNKAVDDTHVHNEGEDHDILLTFDQLFGGGQGVYGTAAHDGVTVNYN